MWSTLMCHDGPRSRTKCPNVDWSRGWWFVASPVALHRHHPNKKFDVLGQETDPAATQSEMRDSAAPRLLTHPPRGCAEPLCNLFRRESAVIGGHVAAPLLVAMLPSADGSGMSVTLTTIRGIDRPIDHTRLDSQQLVFAAPHVDEAPNALVACGSNRAHPWRRYAIEHVFDRDGDPCLLSASLFETPPEMCPHRSGSRRWLSLRRRCRYGHGSSTAEAATSRSTESPSPGQVAQSGSATWMLAVARAMCGSGPQPSHVGSCPAPPSLPRLASATPLSACDRSLRPCDRLS